MSDELQQEQAALYVLGLLEGDEADAFERQLAAEPDLRTLVRELREAAAALPLVTWDADTQPPAHLKEKIVRRVAEEAAFATGVPPSASPPKAEPAAIIRPRFGWVPWAAAAALLGCCALLFADRALLVGRIASLQRLADFPTPAPLDALSKVAFVELEPTSDASAKPRAAALWDATRHRGVLRVTQLAPPSPGKDYQLWAVEAARKEPVNAGVIHVNADGQADVPFQPEPIPGDNRVVALAISLEPAGGSPKSQGPILFLGKL